MSTPIPVGKISPLVPTEHATPAPVKIMAQATCSNPPHNPLATCTAKINLSPLQIDRDLYVNGDQCELDTRVPNFHYQCYIQTPHFSPNIPEEHQKQLMADYREKVPQMGTVDVDKIDGTLIWTQLNTATSATVSYDTANPQALTIINAPKK